jgi:hypothetical protein
MLTLENLETIQEKLLLIGATNEEIRNISPSYALGVRFDIEDMLRHLEKIIANKKKKRNHSNA